MAKSRSGNLGGISGSIGNIEHYTSSQGDIVRAKPVHLHKETPALGRVHTRLSGASKAWAFISYEQAMAWSAFAKTFTYKDKVGKVLHYRGRDVFIMVNSNLLEINEPLRFNPPKLIYPKHFKSFEAQIDSVNDIDNLRLFFKPAISKKTKIIVFATNSLKRGVFFAKPGWHKKIAVLDSTFISGSSILNDYLKIFKPPYLLSYSISFKFTAVSVVSGFTIDLPDSLALKNM